MLTKFFNYERINVLVLLGLILYSSTTFSNESAINVNEQPKTVQPMSDENIVIDLDEFDLLPDLPQQNLATQLSNNSDEAQTAEKTDSTLQPFNKEKADQLLKKIMESFEKISFSLESIALVLSHNQLRIKDKTPMMEEVMKLRSLTHMISASAITEINAEKLNHLITLAQELIDHIRYLLTTDLMTFAPFDKKMQLPTRSALEKPVVAPTIEQLDTLLQKTNVVLSKLESEAVNVGLNTFNIVFRRIEKLNDDYKIVNKCLWGLGISTVAAGVLLALDTQYVAKIGGVFDKALQYVGLQPKSQEATTEEPIEKEDQSNGSVRDFHNPILGTRTSSSNSNHTQPESNQTNQQHPKALTDEDLKNFGLISRAFLRWKLWMGDALADRMLMEEMPANGRIVGEGTRVQNLLTRIVPIVQLGIPPFVIYEFFKEPLKEAGNNCLDWFQTKRSQLASLLRGGPVKKGLKRFERESKYTFDDVIGTEHAKMVFSRLVEYFVDPESFDRGGMAPVNAILFAGPTRTGKSFFAEAFHGEVKRALELRGSKTNFAYFTLSAAELKEYGVKNIFAFAKYNAPCILFIDEIDKGQFQDDRDSHALSELQVAMSELNTDVSKKVIVIAATNKPENMNETIRADGRFGVTIPFTSPTLQDRKEYLTRELSKRAAIIDEFYIEQLAYETEGANYDSLKAILMTAFHKAKIKGVTLSWTELEEALDEQFHKMIFDEKTLPDKELILVAAHQIAHAFMRITLNPSLQLTKVTIRPISPKIDEVSVIGEALSGTKKPKQEILKYGEIFTAHKSNALKFDTYQDLISELKICLAGHIAEKVLLGGTSHSYHEHDTKEAFELAKRLTFNGMNEDTIPKVIKEQKLVEAYELIHKYEQEVTEFLTEHKEELTLLTNILFEEKTLPGSTVSGLLKEIKKRKKEDALGDKEEHSSPTSEDFDALDLVTDQEINLDKSNKDFEDITDLGATA